MGIFRCTADKLELQAERIEELEVELREANEALYRYKCEVTDLQDKLLCANADRRDVVRRMDELSRTVSDITDNIRDIDLRGCELK